MERVFLSQKGSGGGRGVKEKQVSMADKSSEVSKHVNVVLGSNSVTRTPKEGGYASDFGFVSGYGSKLGDDTSSKLGEVPSSSQEGFVVTSEPLQSHANVAMENDVGNTMGQTPAGNTPGMSSYANVAGASSRKALNFRTLFTPGGNGIDVVVLVESIRAISKRFANTTYGFFLGKRVAYPVVANYVKNTWDGLDAMLENGPWFIRNNLLILKKWHPDANLLKEDVGNVPVWVKLHGVPVTAFSEDGLSVIATKLGTPLMLDSYTSDMCMQSWGRSSYTRAMIELRADAELKDNVVVAMPKITGDGFYTCNIRVEYEWKPPRCACCKVFGHVQEECPRNIGAGKTKNLKKPS
ncbi:putative reverse transcriptase domain-containing protein [Tanacetum coccineum]|uniref:Reverse transcriptase domain-containing protein n=1 Tax=Tanacetum coccineum TaxID=301880 RepID=A0ABQ5CF20_9ASTR